MKLLVTGKWRKSGQNSPHYEFVEALVQHPGWKEHQCHLPAETQHALFCPACPGEWAKADKVGESCCTRGRDTQETFATWQKPAHMNFLSQLWHQGTVAELPLRLLETNLTKAHLTITVNTFSCKLQFFNTVVAFLATQFNIFHCLSDFLVIQVPWVRFTL